MMKQSSLICAALALFAAVSLNAWAADLTDNEITSDSNPAPGNITFGNTSKSDRFSTTPGSSELDNGMIIKWGLEENKSTTLLADQSASFDSAFPNDLLTLNAVLENVSGGLSLDSVTLEVTGFTLSGFTYRLECVLGAILCLGVTADVRWQATGY